MQSHSLHDNQNTNMNTTKSDKKVTVIAGDSIVKNLHCWRLSDMNNHVVVKSFAGATIEDMGNYLKPVICKYNTTNSNFPDKVRASGVHSLGISDHSLIYMIRKSNWRVIDANNSVTKRQFKNFNDDEFLNDLREINWSDIHSLVDPNDMWSVWLTKFSTLFVGYSCSDQEKET